MTHTLALITAAVFCTLFGGVAFCNLVTSKPVQDRWLDFCLVCSSAFSLYGVGFALGLWQ